MTSPAEHAATVPAWVLFLPNEEQDYVLALAARADELELDLRNMERAADRDRRDREEMGNALARERAKPGGTFDQWARLQAAEDRAHELERQLADARVLIDVEWPNQVSQLEARADELERERDEAYDNGFNRASEMVTNKLEGRAERAEAALREIDEAGLRQVFTWQDTQARLRQVLRIARAALGEQPQISAEGMIQPQYRPGDLDEWNIISEKVEPHGLCCEKCKQARVLLADAKDALAANVSACCPDYWPDREDSDEQCQECATARALLARIEELEGKA